MDNPVHPGIPGEEQKQATWTLWRSGRSKADAPFLDRRRLLTPAAPGGYILTPLFTQMPSRVRTHVPGVLPRALPRALPRVRNENKLRDKG